MAFSHLYNNNLLSLFDIAGGIVSRPCIACRCWPILK